MVAVNSRTRQDRAAGHVRAGERFWPSAWPRGAPQPPATAVLRVRAPSQHRRGQPGPQGPEFRLRRALAVL